MPTTITRKRTKRGIEITATNRNPKPKTMRLTAKQGRELKGALATVSRMAGRKRISDFDKCLSCTPGERIDKARSSRDPRL